MLAERIKPGAGGIGHQGHIGFIDLLEAGDRGAVEGQALLESLVLELAGRNREVLHDADEVTESHVDELDALTLHKFQHFVRPVEHVFLRSHGPDPFRPGLR